MHMKKQIFVRAAASAAVLILLSPLLAGAAAAVQPDVSRSASGASADASAGVLRAELPRLSAKSAVLLDASTGRVLYASHAEDKSLIASTTKIMTALVICEAGDLDRTVVIPPEAVGIEGSSMYLKAGEVLSVHELLYGLMLRSGNDAAVALALADSGSISVFAMRMNEKAAVLGLKNTHYANPHGLDSEENYSTALDLARLTRFALQNPDFAQLVSTKSVTIGDRVLTNHNKLLWQYSGAIGVKTGYTRTAGRILVGAAERDGRRLIAVTIADPNDWADHAALLDYGFSQFSERQLVTADSVVGQIPVISGVEDYVNLISHFSFSYPLADGEQPELRLLAPHFVFAPCDTVSATLEVWLDGTRIGALPLRLAAPVAENPVQKSIFQRIFGE